jgi:hypothetical protein
MDVKLLEYMQERAANIKNYSSKLTDTLKEIDGILDNILSCIPFNYVDETVLYKASGNDGYTTYNLKIKANQGILVRVNSYDNYEYDYMYVYEVSGFLQKLIVKRLPDFLKEYSEFLEKKEAEYKEISEISEKMLDAIRSKTEFKTRSSRYGSIIRD